MFLEFPDDEKCWDIKDQYMFGPKLLVAPILELHAAKRKVYLPEGTWTNAFTKETIQGGQTLEVDAPIDEIPLFIRG